MAFNGLETFERIYNWVNVKANGYKIIASRMDVEFDGIATGLSQCITKNGQTTISANIPMPKKHSNLFRQINAIISAKLGSQSIYQPQQQQNYELQ